MGIGVRLSWKFDGCCSMLVNCWKACCCSWKGWVCTCRSECMLSSRNRCGRVVSVVGCGKLYLGVVVIVYCSITGFTNNQYGMLEIFKCCACASCTIQ